MLHKPDNNRRSSSWLVGEGLSEKAEDKINEIVARLNKLAKKHREIDARMKKLEASLSEKKSEASESN
jgi:hypothetical protein